MPLQRADHLPGSRCRLPNAAAGKVRNMRHEHIRDPNRGLVLVTLLALITACALAHSFSFPSIARQLAVFLPLQIQSQVWIKAPGIPEEASPSLARSPKAIRTGGAPELADCTEPSGR